MRVLLWGGTIGSLQISSMPLKVCFFFWKVVWEKIMIFMTGQLMTVGFWFTNVSYTKWGEELVNH